MGLQQAFRRLWRSDWGLKQRQVLSMAGPGRIEDGHQITKICDPEISVAC